MSFEDHAQSAVLGVVTGAGIVGLAAAGTIFATVHGAGAATAGFIGGAGTGAATFYSGQVAMEGDMDGGGYKFKKKTFFASTAATIAGLALAFSAVTGHKVYEQEQPLKEKIVDACAKGGEQKPEHKGAFITVNCPAPK